MSDNISNILETFETISLEEMDRVRLMNRVDVKYTFRDDQLGDFLIKLKEHYRILEVSGCRSSRYESLYFDTPEFDLYHKHHSGRLNRYKIRLRKYVESNLHFFEIKFKNNKGRTLKNRIKQQQVIQTIEGNAEEFLALHTTLPAEGLEPKLWVNYNRITLVHRTIAERVTLDLNLVFKTNEETREIPNLVIAEVKQDKVSTSAFVRLMRDNFIREGSISKYCFAVTVLFREKFNNFKSQLHLYKKITK
ncbi:MAG: polyphosphate polymerase domain-containing protein [Bacteroidota bacterium]